MIIIIVIIAVSAKLNSLFHENTNKPEPSTPPETRQPFSFLDESNQIQH